MAGGLSGLEEKVRITGRLGRSLVWKRLGVFDGREAFCRDRFPDLVSGRDVVFLPVQPFRLQDEIQDDSQQKQAGKACQQKYGEEPDAHLTDPPSDHLIGRKGPGIKF